MKSWTRTLIIGICGVALVACVPIPKNLKVAVPVRACVVNGSTWTTDGAPFGAAGHVSQMMDSVNAIWQQTNVAFVFLPNPKLIDDPQPPGMSLDGPPFVAKGKLGDSRLDDERDLYGSDEGQADRRQSNLPAGDK
jgi:hypothetical protein